MARSLDSEVMKIDIVVSLLKLCDPKIMFDDIYNALHIFDLNKEDICNLNVDDVEIFEKVTKFDAKKIINHFDVETYLKNILKVKHLNNSPFFLGIYFYAKCLFKRKLNLKIKENQQIPLFAGCLSLAQKFILDYRFKDKDLSNISLVPIDKLNRIQIFILCELLNQKIFVTKKRLSMFGKWITGILTKVHANDHEN